MFSQVYLQKTHLLSTLQKPDLVTWGRPWPRPAPGATWSSTYRTGPTGGGGEQKRVDFTSRNHPKKMGIFDMIWAAKTRDFNQQTLGFNIWNSNMAMEKHVFLNICLKGRSSTKVYVKLPECNLYILLKLWILPGKVRICLRLSFPTFGTVI